MNFLQNLVTLAQDSGGPQYEQDPQFLVQLVNEFIPFAETRIYRDLDLLNTRVEDDTGKLSPNRRNFVLPTSIGQFVVPETIRLIVDGVTRPALSWVSHDALDVIWPDDHAAGVPSIPTKVAPRDELSVDVGPAPDQPYQAITFGTQRPLSLTTGVTLDLTTIPPTIAISNNSPAATGTYLSNNLPDLFHAAEMIDVSAFQRNFGAMVEDPGQAVSWTSEYERLKGSSAVEEFRKKFQLAGGNRLVMPAAPRAA